jgi:hypothetical protein
MSKNLQKLKDLVASVDEDAEKFFVKGNGLAGARVRKIMQEVKEVAQAIRFEVSEIKNTKGGDKAA